MNKDEKVTILGSDLMKVLNNIISFFY